MAPMSDEKRREAVEQAVMPVVIFATSIPIAFATPTGAQLWWLLLLVSHRMRRTSAWRRLRRTARAPARDGASQPPADGPSSG
jgi:hypothetical protein